MILPVTVVVLHQSAIDQIRDTIHVEFENSFGKFKEEFKKEFDKTDEELDMAGKNFDRNFDKLNKLNKTLDQLLEKLDKLNAHVGTIQSRLGSSTLPKHAL
ncbi:hypothetical protein FSARC_12671 [Fusarium sarcochroum]|uniref:Uncharacterized protein n=1 Tax=Fusarium sarcochroum TaxID=1208366 RepID=A0A8H4T6V6_9HYPO|nr:hypothetical protein FSARC_12671 [Fusarium sarcochroum]